MLEYDLVKMGQFRSIRTAGRDGEGRYPAASLGLRSIAAATSDGAKAPERAASNGTR